MKGYYVKAKNLATVRKIGVHKGELHVRAFGRRMGSLQQAKMVPGRNSIAL